MSVNLKHFHVYGELVVYYLFVMGTVILAQGLFGELVRTLMMTIITIVGIRLVAIAELFIVTGALFVERRQNRKS